MAARPAEADAVIKWRRFITPIHITELHGRRIDGAATSRLVNLSGGAVCGFQRRFLSPGHLGGICSGEMNAAAGTSHFGPEARQLTRLVTRSFAHSGIGVLRP